ncbi:MAG: SdrD B-like domain-containing protein [Niameybacter sp.]
MATFITQVDRMQVNYEQVFVYTLNVSFNGIQGNIQSAKIKVFVPNTIQYTLDDVQAPVKGVLQEAVEGGTKVIFDFGAIVDLGIAARLSMGCQFKLSTLSGAIYSSAPELWINNSLYLIANVSAVTLNVQPQFEMESVILLPTVAPAPGGQIYYRFELVNLGDKGGEVENVVITCPMPTGLTLDDTFPVKGKDVSSAPFQDTSADGIEGVIVNNQLTFTIPRYRGTNYQVMYRVLLSPTLLVGTELVTIINWTAHEIEQLSDTHKITLAAPIYTVTISKYGPDYSMPNQPISYELYLVNDGNQPLINVNIIDELPTEVEYNQFQTGTFYYGIIDCHINGQYTIAYTTLKGLSGILGPYSTEINNTVRINTFITSGDAIETLSWQLAALGIGVRQQIPPQINGVVKSDVAVGTSIFNHFYLSWVTAGGTQSRVSNQTTIVNDFCVLQPEFSQVSPNTSLIPGRIVRYRMQVNCRRSRLNNPIIALLLPATLEYVGNTTVSYADYFPNENTPRTPPVTVIPNFKNTGLTLVKFTYSGRYSFDFSQKFMITIELDVKVKIGAIGLLTVNFLLNNVPNTGIIPSGVDIYRDRNDIAQTGNNNQLYAQSASVSNEILFFAGTASDKKVKGALDTVYVEEPLVGHTAEGGLIEYLLTISNIGNTDLLSVEVVDILPHIGDTGVIEVEEARLSEFVFYNINEIAATIAPLDIGQIEPVILVEYSKSYDPARFDKAFKMIGTVDDWTTQLPPVATDLAAFKVSTGNIILKPNQTLTVKVQGITPVGVLPEKIAWNSFAARVSYKDFNGSRQYLLAVEPEKVGVEVVNLPPGVGQIGGLVWIDTNRDGMHVLGEAGVNDIPVVLYNEEGRSIQATFTTPSASGVDGYYLFNNLPYGNYYVRFIINEPEYRFTLMQPQAQNGSKVDPKTGLSPLIRINDLTPRDTLIYAGIIERNMEERVDVALLINNEAHKIMKNVLYNQLLLSMKLEESISLFV